jgi:hypothetical protein
MSDGCTDPAADDPVINTLVLKTGKFPHLQRLDLCLPQLEDVERAVPPAVEMITVLRVQDCTFSDMTTLCHRVGSHAVELDLVSVSDGGHDSASSFPKALFPWALTSEFRC